MWLPFKLWGLDGRVPLIDLLQTAYTAVDIVFLCCISVERDSVGFRFGALIGFARVIDCLVLHERYFSIEICRRK
jgi:hypothetical protein